MSAFITLFQYTWLLSTMGGVIFLTYFIPQGEFGGIIGCCIAILCGILMILGEYTYWKKNKKSETETFLFFLSRHF